jgi:putative peptidoglycan lipid II flippase
MSETDKNKKPFFVAKAALFFSFGTLSSRILGLIRDSLFFSLMPLDMKDAWLAAFKIPNFFRRLLGEGGLSVSFIPIYVSVLEKNNEDEKKALINGVYSLLMSMVSLICLISFIFMDQIVHYWLGGAGFAGVPGKLELTVQMSKIMILFLFFISLFAYYMALLNGVKKFTLTGFAPVLLNISMVLGLVLFEGHEKLAYASAWSVVIGGALQAFILIPSVRKARVWPHFTFNWSDKQVKKVLTKFLPTIIGVGILQILAVVNVYFASQLEPGAVSYMYLADRLLELPLSLIAVSIGTALLPMLSQYWSQQKTELFKRSIVQYICLFNLLALPAAFGLWFIGLDILDILFSRGEFKAREVVIVSDILKIFSFTLLCGGALKIMTQAFYAAGDTMTPAIVSFSGLMVHLVLAPYLMGIFGLNGLIISTSFITFLNLVLCFVILHFKIGWLDWRKLSVHFFKCFIACTLMALYLYGFRFVSWRKGSFVYDFPVLTMIIAGAGVIYFVIVSLFKIEEMSYIKRRFLKK